ncbi:MAG: hypothetical protein JNL01_08090 [Bdellovibrionales bacterium]|nr:hypothetical protein [Bdellovibrionales bacterium]
MNLKFYSIAIAAAALFTLSACTNQIGRPTSRNTTTSSGTLAESDGAQGQCRNIDKSSPDRLTCKSCYQTLLSSQCGSVSASNCSAAALALDPASCCQDAAVKKNFPALVNQCILQTNTAGFTCGITCPSSQVLNTSTCQCVAPTVTLSTVGAGGTTYIDTGVTDFGPPVVSAVLSTSSLEYYSETSYSGAMVNTCGPSTTTAPPVWLGVRNRGSSIPALNTFGAPVASSNTNAASNPMAPTPPPPTAMNGPGGANAVLQFIFQSGGLTEFGNADTVTHKMRVGTNASGGQPGNLILLSGRPNEVIPWTLPSFPPANVPNAEAAMSLNGMATGDEYMAAWAEWGRPLGGARDRWGNIYFTNQGNVPSIRVICNDVRSNNEGAGIFNFWCAGREVGKIYTAVGAANLAPADYTVGNTPGTCTAWATGGAGCSASTGAAATTARLASPVSVVLDRYGNIYFSESSGLPNRNLNLIAVACAAQTVGFCSGRGYVANEVRAFLGSPPTNSNSAAYSPTMALPATPLMADGTAAASQLNGPMGLDIETSGTSLNVVWVERGTYCPTCAAPIALGSGNIRRYCEFASTQGPCRNFPQNTVLSNTSIYTLVTNPLAAGNRVARVTSPTPYTNGTYPTLVDVKMNIYGNLFATETTGHRIWKVCYDSTKDDFCKGSLGFSTLIGSGNPYQNGSMGTFFDGAPVAAGVTLTYPLYLALNEPYGDYSVAVDGIANIRDQKIVDNNIAFTQEGGRWTVPGGAGGLGNDVRILCGDNRTSPVLNAGYCRGRNLKTAWKLAGIPGVPRGAKPQTSLVDDATGYIWTTNYAADPAQSYQAGSAKFSALNGPTGITYDGNGQLVIATTASPAGNVPAVTSTWDPSPVAMSDNYRDNSLFLIQLLKETERSSGIRYRFTDSNNLSADYCLRFSITTACYQLNDRIGCNCLPKVGQGAAAFWSGIPLGSSCP